MAGKPRRYTDEQLARAVAASRNMREVLIALGLAPRGGNYETVRRRIAVLGLDATHLHAAQTRGRGVQAFSDDEIKQAVGTARSLSQALAELGIRVEGNQTRLKRRLEELGIDTLHFVGQAWRRGSQTPTVPAAPIEGFLVAGRACKTAHLKLRLIREGLKDSKCEMCGLRTWNSRPIPLELDHVNGRRDDNRLENLRLLCPNCHALTPTHRGKNIGLAMTYSR
jgi:hypothetical protein